MKKIYPIVFLSSLILASFISLPLRSGEAAFAKEQEIEYVSLGPGIYNSKQTHTPEDKFRPSGYCISYRSSALMLFPNRDVYKDEEFNKTVLASDLVDTDYSKVRIYTSQTTYKTLDKYFALGDVVKYNIYNDACQNVSFFLDGNQLAPKNIYQIVFEEGFVLPYPSTSQETRYVIKETVTFKHNDYQKEKTDIVYADEWTQIKSTEQDEEEEEGGIELIPSAVFTREDPNYRAQIRGAHITEEMFNIDGALDNDDGSCRLLLFFGENDYNKEIYGSSTITINPEKFDISDAETSYLHTLYEKVVFTTVDNQKLTLREVANPLKKGLPVYNTYGEYGSISFQIGNIGCEDEEVSYHGASFKTITVLRGAQFPTYRYTHLDSKVEYRFEQADDVTVEFNSFAKHQLWNTYAEYSFNAADIEVTNVNVRKVNINNENLVLNATVIDIGLSECNYGSGEPNTEIITLGEKMTRYVYLNGRSLYYSFNHNDLKAYANLDGLEDTISLVVPVENIEDINEIIVQRGCSVPSLVASAITMEIYGGYVSYYVLSSVSYTRKDQGFVPSEKLYWTLWFDGKNPIRVANAATFDFSENAPIGDETDQRKFVKWQDENGNDVTGYIRINSGREYFGVYAYSYYVQFKNIDHEKTIKVERYTRLTNVEEIQNIIIPRRNGYSFQGWVDEDNNHFNINNRILRDMVLTATWIKTNNAVNNNTNTSMVLVIALSSLAGVIVIADVVVFILKRRKR